MRGCILLVDDQPGRRAGRARALEDAGYAVAQAVDAEHGWTQFRERTPDLVITDAGLARGEGRALLREIRGRSDVPVIVVGDAVRVDGAMGLVEARADDPVCAEGTAAADLVRRADQAIGRGGSVPAPHALAQRLAGPSDAMARVRARVAGLAPLRQPVVVVGEEGTGRSTVVRALHELGSTAGGSLVRVDCASWEPTRGAPRAAAVHLDGVEGLSPEAQAFWADLITGRLAPASGHAPRVLASAGPLFGAPESAPAPAERGAEPARRRLVAALSRFPIELPPLRDRPEDVVPVARAIVRRLSRTMARPVTLSAAASSLLEGRRWCGNVAQLEQLLERAVAFTTAGEIEAGLLVELVDEVENGLGTIRRHRAHHERETLMSALRRTGGNVSQTAAILGRSRGAVYRLMAKHGVTARGPA